MTLMEIYNINGEKVKTLVNETLGAGLHDISWRSLNYNGNAVSGGIYFCKIQVRGQSNVYHGSKKMILLK
jgi:flagellar hook assembly protein FlgD